MRTKAEGWLSGELKLGHRPTKLVVKYLRGNHCEVCGIKDWNGREIVFELEHKNGNSDDNSPQNVCLICPNCHSQTPTYKNRNAGNGRHSRRQRYRDGKSY